MAKIQKLDNKECIDLFEKIINCIKKQERGFFVLKKLRKVEGWCEWDSVIIDYRKQFIPTIIHECLHLLHPEWSESQVYYSEKRIVNTISEDDVVQLLIIFIKKL